MGGERRAGRYVDEVDFVDDTRNATGIHSTASIY